LDGFLNDTTLSAAQIDFIKVVIDYLALRGWIDPGLLYESPFTDFSLWGVDGVFKPP
jgi:type I restriction enzyme R subunit